MNWNQHFDLKGRHAFLSPSKHSWLNYDKDKLKQSYLNSLKKEEGIILHDFASRAIMNKIKLADYKKALNMFVNDSIGFRMESEQLLYYSDICFGTADAIKYEELENSGVLRIFDLKNGVSKVSFDQLYIYSALFFLEYSNIKLLKTKVILRIYQGNGYEELEADNKIIKDIMRKIVNFDKELISIRSEL